MGWTEAWRLWAQGELDPHALLWGLQLFWWGRIGKALQLIAGAMIVIEIVGPERLRRFGESLDDRLRPESLRALLLGSGTWLVAHILFHVVARAGSEQRGRAGARLDQPGAATLNFVLSAALGVWIGVNAHFGLVYDIGAGIFVAAVGMMVAVPLLITVLLTIAALVGLSLRMAVIAPAVRILESDSLDRGAKLVALVLLLVGFHFDFLSS
jgi:hypothetical protein